jgi:hypothetical protein
MKNIDLETQKKMQQELEKYLARKDTPKTYFASMKEISTWLASKAEQ